MAKQMVKYVYGDDVIFAERYDTIDKHYTIIVSKNWLNYPVLELLDGKELVIEDDTGYLKVFNTMAKSHQVWFDTDKNSYMRAVYNTSTEKYEYIIRCIKSRIISMNLIPETYEKFIRINDNRDVWVPRKISGIFRSLMTHVASENAKGEHITYDELIHYILHEMKDKDFLQRKYLTFAYTDYVLTVNRPKFRREVGNKNTKTFDFIDIEMVVRSTDATKEKVIANKDEIFKKAIEKLENNKSFHKYGVPINFLKMYQFIVRKDGTLIISFCIKDDLLGNRSNNG